MTNAYAGRFMVTLEGYCGVEHESENFPLFEDRVHLDCSVLKYDNQHLSRSNWLMVDAITGIVLYSSFTFMLSGRTTTSSGANDMYPLFTIEEEVIYAPLDHSFWPQNQSAKELYTLQYWIVVAVSIAISLVIIGFVKIIVELYETQHFYNVLTYRRKPRRFN